MLESVGGGECVVVVWKWWCSLRVKDGVDKECVARLQSAARRCRGGSKVWLLWAKQERYLSRCKP